MRSLSPIDFEMWPCPVVSSTSITLPGYRRMRVPSPMTTSLSPLTVREQEVLRLVADGHPTREVAKRLSYSERTVKNVIHDVVTKFNARSRSQAVAAAVREGLI